MPGYTHLQRAQPVYLSHHLLAYVWMLVRDRERFASPVAGDRRLPLGAGALAGVNFDTDRRWPWRASSASPAVAENSIDAVSNRDFVLDYLAAAATCATHLSRLGAEIVLWSSEEFGFCEVSDAWASGSSIMPQKKNPDAAELLRAKAPRIAAHLVALHGVMHGLPLTYNKDMQEDKEHLFDAVDTLELCLEAAEGMLGSISFRRERLAGAASDEFLAATDIADLLVRRGMPFREAHGVVAGLVRTALREGTVAVGLTREELAAHSELLDDEFYAVLSDGAWLESKVSEGGTSLPRVREQLERARTALGVNARLLRPPGARGRARAGRVRGDASSGVIVETEAYHDSEPACHAFVGLTPRTRTLFGPPGVAYVPLLRDPRAAERGSGAPEGVGAAVLIRALEPLSGIETMRRRRGLSELRALCSGPGKLTQALGIELPQRHRPARRSARDLRTGRRSWQVPVSVDRRIGITKAVELPWRFSPRTTASCRDAPVSGRPVRRRSARPVPWAFRHRSGPPPEPASGCRPRRRATTGAAAAPPAAASRRRRPVPPPPPGRARRPGAGVPPPPPPLPAPAARAPAPAEAPLPYRSRRSNRTRLPLEPTPAAADLVLAGRARSAPPGRCSARICSAWVMKFCQMTAG